MVVRGVGVGGEVIVVGVLVDILCFV
jgi:hypothetical protein